MIKYILSYVVMLVVTYFCNDIIVELLNGKQALIRFIELTIPLTAPSLLYFFQINKDRHERIEREKEREERLKSDEKDKFEKSLPFFFVREQRISARNPQKSPILNAKIQIGTIESDFLILGEMHSEGSIHSEYNDYIGGLVDDDSIQIDSILGSNSASGDIRWYVLSAITITNDSIYFVYLPSIKMGWHFYQKKDSQNIVKYIGESSYCKLAELLVTHISENGEEFSNRESFLNSTATCLKAGNSQEALAQLIILARNVKLPKYELLYLLNEIHLMIHYLESSKKIDVQYFKGNLFRECAFTNKYKNLLEQQSPNFMMQEYLKDIIDLVDKDHEVSLDFWLRNVEVYVREQSRVFNKMALNMCLKRIIPSLIGGRVK